MLTGAETTAPELLDLEEPSLALADPVGGEIHDRIGHGELSHGGDLGVLVFTHPQGSGRKRPEPPGQLMQEVAELAIAIRERLERLEAVDHDEPGAALLDHAGDLLDDARQPVTVDDRAEILVENRSPDRGRVEETQALAEAHNFLERLGDG